MAVGFLQIVDGHVRMGSTLAGWPDLDDDTVRERWLTGLALAYAAISPDTDEPVGATVARVVLAALAADPTASFTDLSRPAREAPSLAHPDTATTFSSAGARGPIPSPPRWIPSSTSAPPSTVAAG